MINIFVLCLMTNSLSARIGWGGETKDSVEVKKEVDANDDNLTAEQYAERIKELKSKAAKKNQANSVFIAYYDPQKTLLNVPLMKKVTKSAEIMQRRMSQLFSSIKQSENMPKEVHLQLQQIFEPYKQKMQDLNQRIEASIKIALKTIAIDSGIELMIAKNGSVYVNPASIDNIDDLLSYQIKNLLDVEDNIIPEVDWDEIEALLAPYTE